MKTLILTTGELRKLGLIKIEEPKEARISRIETNYKGYNVYTLDKSINETGLFPLTTSQIQFAIAAATNMQHKSQFNTELTGSVIHAFIQSINETCDTDKSSLKVTYHKTVKGLDFKATMDLATLFKEVKVGEHIELIEGWEVPETAIRTPFEDASRIYSYSFIISKVAGQKFKGYLEALQETQHVEKMKGIEPLKNIFPPMSGQSIRDSMFPAKAILSDKESNKRLEKIEANKDIIIRHKADFDYKLIRFIVIILFIIWLFTPSHCIRQARKSLNEEIKRANSYGTRDE
jgi:hypothetical protein